ncbi:hypothetical protein NIES267_58080 [Calothrix parasitica NIES-267]|uniref:Uncharacterized protein n=1 Tax=Calothrix parasitica NIES-267 TaxID=1973488 RepID=A0A1Z4LYL0_9CYAN|nr:hypothetical protein NIES267_58080 [Calothrix parasitica NIES-267]
MRKVEPVRFWESMALSVFLHHILDITEAGQLDYLPDEAGSLRLIVGGADKQYALFKKSLQKILSQVRFKLIPNLP